MNRFHKSAIAIAAIGAAFLISGIGCEHAGIYATYNQPIYEPGPVAGYDYYYYPESEVYFQPSLGIYFWRDRDDHNWHQGRDLPHYYSVHAQNRVNVHLNTDRPYTMHAQVQAEHPWHH